MDVNNGMVRVWSKCLDQPVLQGICPKNTTLISPGQPNLCLAGGVALNSVVNGKLLRRGPFERIYIQGAANDSGCALGAALYRAHAVHGLPWREMRHSNYGPGYTTAEIEKTLQVSHMPYRSVEDPAETAAQLLVHAKQI